MRRISIIARTAILLSILLVLAAFNAPADICDGLIQEDMSLPAASGVAHGQGLLFRVSREGVQPSWLFATMHVADAAITNLADPPNSSVIARQILR